MKAPVKLQHVHFSTETPGDQWFRFANWRDAAKHADHSGHLHIPVRGLDHFIEVLTSLRGAELASFDVHSHGSPGGFDVGAVRLDRERLRQKFANKGFETIVAPGGTVTLNGCYIARNPDGEVFIAEFAEAFLKRGGTLVAATDPGKADWLMTGEVSHAPAAIVKAVVSGGAVALQNHFWLHAHKIREAVRNDERFIRDHFRPKAPGDTLVNGVIHVCDREHRTALAIVGHPSVQPTYADLKTALSAYGRAHVEIEKITDWYPGLYRLRRELPTFPGWHCH